MIKLQGLLRPGADSVRCVQRWMLSHASTWSLTMRYGLFCCPSRQGCSTLVALGEPAYREGRRRGRPAENGCYRSVHVLDVCAFCVNAWYLDCARRSWTGLYHGPIYAVLKYTYICTQIMDDAVFSQLLTYPNVIISGHQARHI